MCRMASSLAGTTGQNAPACHRETKGFRFAPALAGLKSPFSDVQAPKLFGTTNAANPDRTWLTIWLEATAQQPSDLSFRPP